MSNFSLLACYQHEVNKTTEIKFLDKVAPKNFKLKHVHACYNLWLCTFCFQFYSMFLISVWYECKSMNNCTSQTRASHACKMCTCGKWKSFTKNAAALIINY